MREQCPVRFADDGLHIEIVEDGGLVAAQTTVLHIIYRASDGRCYIGTTFHSVGENILIINGFWKFFVTDVFRYPEQLPKEDVGLVLGNQGIDFSGGLAVVEIAALQR